MAERIAAPAGADILIVEDEPKMAALLMDYLRAREHRPRHLASGARVIDAVRQARPDLILLDWMLPGLDGLSLCQQLRRFSDVPIIMLTARTDEADRLQGLDGGADDYICKTPFSPREIVSRVQAMLRRTQGALQRPQSSSPLRIDDAAFRAWFMGHALELTPAEFRLLRVLAASPGRVFSRERLLDHLYADHRAVTDRTVDSHIKNLRRKLAAIDAACEPIQSVYGVGYRLEWP